MGMLVNMFDALFENGIRPDPIIPGFPDKKQFYDLIDILCKAQGWNTLNEAPIKFREMVGMAWCECVDSYYQAYMKRLSNDGS